MPDTTAIPISKCFSWSWAAPFFQSALRHIQRHPLNEENAEIIWKTRHKTVWKTALPQQNGGLTVVWKDYTNKRFWRFFFRPSFSAREAAGYRVLLHCTMPEDQRKCSKCFWNMVQTFRTLESTSGLFSLNRMKKACGIWWSRGLMSHGSSRTEPLPSADDIDAVAPLVGKELFVQITY